MKLFIIGMSVLLTACGSSSPSYESNDEQSGSRYEMANPYSDGTGHYAGYEWAERTGGSCDGNSASFNEGCEEYHSQLERYERSQ